jgi:hypothetical protein
VEQVQACTAWVLLRRTLAMKGDTMKSEDNVYTFTDKDDDWLDDLMTRENTDEMGLLDLIFMEEIVNQKMEDDAA